MGDDSARRSPSASFDIQDYSLQPNSDIYFSHSSSSQHVYSVTPSYHSGSTTPPTITPGQSWLGNTAFPEYPSGGPNSGTTNSPVETWNPQYSGGYPRYPYMPQYSFQTQAATDYYATQAPTFPIMYKHSDLGPEEVRLLKLRPHASKSPGDPIHVQLMHVSIHDLVSMEYEALSYAWGTAQASNHIYVSEAEPLNADTNPPNGDTVNQGHKLFQVRSNLYGALSRLRSSTRDILLWVDALCIDQSNDQEKASQLPKMPQIYSNAWSVVIWLGEDPQNSEKEKLAMDFIPRMLNLTLLDALLENEGENSRILHSWLAFADLLKRPWFHRRWVIQEIAYAKRVAIRCGEKVLSWLDFADAIEILSRRLDKVADLYKSSRLFLHDADALSHVHSGRALALVNATNTVFRKTRNGEVLDRLWSLEALVTEYTSFEASNPRDVIYAFLSLASDGPLATGALVDGENSPNRALLPQYEKDPIDVYIEFVKYCVETTKYLDIICRHWASYTDPFKTTPSWIGPVKNSAFGMPSESSGRVNGDSLVGKPKQRIYNASRGLLAAVRFEKPPILGADVTIEKLAKPMTTFHRTQANEQLEGAIVSAGVATPDNKNSVDDSPDGQPVSKGGTGLADTDPLPTTTKDQSVSDSDQNDLKQSPQRRAPGDISQEKEKLAARRRQQHRSAAERFRQRREERLRNSECCLFAKGIVLGRISKVSSRVIDGIIPGDCLSILGWERDMDFNRFPDQLWRTLVADRNSDGKNAPMWYKRACAYAMLRANSEGDLNTSKIITSKIQPESIVEYCKRVQSIVWNRSFFVCGDVEDDDSVDIRSSPGTERLVGLGSRNMRVHDVVCILFGCSVPVVLRPKYGRYELVGEAYVYGKMDGEAFAGMDLDVIQAEAEEFEIR
ncbi:HET-domain-containing protein [Paramyrothecium foliicola]|nr:HET-domain-containing protein [Paramyrothecium foliicola]